MLERGSSVDGVKLRRRVFSPPHTGESASLGVFLFFPGHLYFFFPLRFSSSSVHLGKLEDEELETFSPPFPLSSSSSSSSSLRIWSLAEKREEEEEEGEESQRALRSPWFTVGGKGEEERSVVLLLRSWPRNHRLVGPIYSIK